MCERARARERGRGLGVCCSLLAGWVGGWPWLSRGVIGVGCAHPSSLISLPSPFPVPVEYSAQEGILRTPAQSISRSSSPMRGTPPCTPPSMRIRLSRTTANPESATVPSPAAVTCACAAEAVPRAGSSLVCILRYLRLARPTPVPTPAPTPVHTHPRRPPCGCRRTDGDGARDTVHHAHALPDTRAEHVSNTTHPFIEVERGRGHSFVACPLHLHTQLPDRVPATLDTEARHDTCCSAVHTAH